MPRYFTLVFLHSVRTFGTKTYGQNEHHRTSILWCKICWKVLARATHSSREHWKTLSNVIGAAMFPYNCACSQMPSLFAAESPIALAHFVRFNYVESSWWPPTYLQGIVTPTQNVSYVRPAIKHIFQMLDSDIFFNNTQQTPNIIIFAEMVELLLP